MHFMLKFALNQPPTEEIMALVPAEQSRGKEMAEQGIREALYVAADQSAVWAVWNCDSRDAVDEVAKTLPLYEFLNYDVTLLGDEDH